jgi:hypothetical protein
VGSIPAEFLVHSVVVRRYLGPTGTGVTYAAAETVPCLVEDVRRLVRDDNGRERVAGTTFRCLPTVDYIPPESEVDVNGMTTTVIVCTKFQAEGLPTPDHWEVSLV